jgi:ATP-dependent exoDNAse (exonuclease V) alpha subunit
MTQKQALNILKLGKNVFLTGAAGSGKTYVLNKYIKYLKTNSIPVAITASTGIAATHMNGKTIHSWAHIGIKEQMTPSDLAHLFARKEYRQSIAEAKVLIIDEVSMLHHYRLDMVDAVLRRMHGVDKPFGGIQVVLCGDLFQLPPVSRGARAQYITESQAWEAMDVHVCYLSEQYRHDDDRLSQLLNEMRSGEVSQQSIEQLNERKNATLSVDIVPTKLYTHNADVDLMNDTELAKLGTKEKTFKMTAKGDRSIYAALQKSCLAPQLLKLKQGAVVMFVQNNYAKGYVNGTLGKVISFDSDGMPVVQTLQGRIITAAKGSWRVEEGQNVLAEINQLPLRLAWAITVHKSQGMTLDAAQIDLSKSFVLGMGYVALSRVRNLDNIRLLGLNSQALQVDPVVIEIDRNLRQSSERHRRSINEYDKERLDTAHKEYIAGLKYEGTLAFA